MSTAKMSSDRQIAIYSSPQGQVDVRLEGDTVWLSQEQMTQLFGRERSVISKHIRNVFNDGELEEESTVQNLHIAQSDKPVRFYNLDVIISVGYRVKSVQGVQFRQWATALLCDKLSQARSTQAQLAQTMVNRALRAQKKDGALCAPPWWVWPRKA
ncbi:MAG: virulence RhuM family protein [Acidovorax sp.]|jgi:hypothetical protein|nr:virulence RhuM family protein [Acidovorax sp.]